MSYHLFIGGPADGERRDVDRDAPTWRVTEWPHETRATPYDPIVDGLVIGKEHVYIRRQYHNYDTKTLHQFYVHSSIDPRDVFGVLVAGYRKPKVTT